MKNLLQSNIVIAFDIGLINIGVAIGNTILKIPHPLEIISEPVKFKVFIEIDKIVKKWSPQLFVLGVTDNQENKKNLMIKINKFKNKLHNNYNLPIIFINEDYSSLVATEMLSQQGVHGYKQKNKLDDLAACVILQRYFDTL